MVRRGLRGIPVYFWASLLFAIVALWTLIPRAIVFDRDEVPGETFDAARWRASLQAPDDRKAVRLRMVDDLLATHRIFRGMTRERVINLLGTPPPTSYFREYDLVYWLGPERGFISIDSEWLVIRFSADNRVAEVRVVRD